MIDSDFVLGDCKEKLKLAEDFEAKKSQSASHKSFNAKVVPNTDYCNYFEKSICLACYDDVFECLVCFQLHLTERKF